MDIGSSKAVGKRQMGSPTRDGHQLRLTGSQVNLLSRSHHGSLRSPTPNPRRSRPNSALPSYKSAFHRTSPPSWRRPMSADDSSAARLTRPLHTAREKLTLEDDMDDDKIEERVSNLRSSYTVASSRLLCSLLGEPWHSEDSETSSNPSEASKSDKSERSLGRRIQEMAQTGGGEGREGGESRSSGQTESTLCLQDLRWKNNQSGERMMVGEEKSKEKEELLDMKFQRWFQGNGKREEKTVRFSEEKDEQSLLEDFESEEETPQHHPRDSDKKDDIEILDEGTFQQESCHYKEEDDETSENVENEQGKSPDLIDLTEESQKPEPWMCSNGCPFSCCQIPVKMNASGSEIKDVFCFDPSEPLNPSTNGNNSFQSDFTTKESSELNRIEGRSVSPGNVLSMEFDSPSKRLSRSPVMEQEGRRKESCSSARSPRDSAYEDIVSILHVLEQEEAESMLAKESAKLEAFSPRAVLPMQTGRSPQDGQLKDILSYLDEVERCSDEVVETAKSALETVNISTARSSRVNMPSLPRLEELLNKSTVELSHEVMSLRIQLEDQGSGLSLLQTTIKEMKEERRKEKAEHEKEICQAASDTDAALQRHQKFIKQLLNEKKCLNEKVSTLIEELKSGEERYQRNLKAVEERHCIEVQRVKETQAVAEKLKREKWIDTKTQKIKEMTVKGLEPELARMAARQQQEMAELRSLHRAELEAVELRGTRRTAELLEQLRGELSKEKEEAILKETTILRDKLEKQLEEEQNRLGHEAKRLREEVRREKERLTNQEAQVQDTLLEARRSFERERERDRVRAAHLEQERTEALQRRHQNEMKSLKETLEIEKESWMTNYKKQQTARFLEREAELHHQYKRERDRDIELVIERLENEATQARLELTQASENKLQRLREKQEAEVRELEESEAMLKQKLNETKEKLSEREERMVECNTQLRQLHAEMHQLKKLCEEMSAQRANLKQIVRQEFEQTLVGAAAEVEAARAETSALRTSHALELARRDQATLESRALAQRELAQVYARVKVTVSKKEEALEALREQHRAVLERCSHLEQMLDHQRRKMLLK